MASDFYWELVTKGDDRYEIPPQAVEVVKRRMNNHDPINLSTASVPFSEIKKFQVTNKPYGSQPLLEAAAQAFKEPIFNEDGSLAGKYVKKSVTQREFAKHYANIPAYRRLADDNGMVVVAFKLPVHEIDLARVDECTEDDLTRLR